MKMKLATEGNETLNSLRIQVEIQIPAKYLSKVVRKGGKGLR